MQGVVIRPTLNLNTQVTTPIPTTTSTWICTDSWLAFHLQPFLELHSSFSLEIVSEKILSHKMSTLILRFLIKCLWNAVTRGRRRRSVEEDQEDAWMHISGAIGDPFWERKYVELTKLY